MNEQQEAKIPFEHYFYLVLWGGSMFLACTPAFGWIWGLLFLTLFFLVTTFKVMKKLILVFLLTFIIGGLLIKFLGEIAAVILIVLPIVSIFLKINFLRKHWKALKVGFYAYFGYVIIMALAGTFGATLPVIGMFIGALIFTKIFHDYLKELYKEGYDTDKAFAIIGLTPIIILSLVLPFLKIDVLGLPIFDGIAPDDVSYDMHKGVSLTSKVIYELIPEEDVKFAMEKVVNLTNSTDIDVNQNVELSDFIKLSGFDINEIINVPVMSHALEAAFSFSAAYGVFKVSSYENDCTIWNEDGTFEIISPVDAVHSVIKNQDGDKIGDIYLDRENNLETVKLSNGFIFSVHQTTGNVFDAEGNLLGKITEDSEGTKILCDNSGAIIRKFKNGGAIVDANDNPIGCAMA